MEHPVGCYHAVGGNGHVCVQEPEPEAFGQQQHYDRNRDKNPDGSREYAPEHLAVTSSQLECQETTHRRRQGTEYNCQQPNQSAHHIIYTEILDTQGFEHHTRGVERHQHPEEHAGVEHQRVLGDAAGVFAVRGHGRKARNKKSGGEKAAEGRGGMGRQKAFRS